MGGPLSSIPTLTLIHSSLQALSPPDLHLLVHKLHLPLLRHLPWSTHNLHLSLVQRAPLATQTTFDGRGTLSSSSAATFPGNMQVLIKVIQSLIGHCRNVRLSHGVGFQRSRSRSIGNGRHRKRENMLGPILTTATSQSRSLSLPLRRSEPMLIKDIEPATLFRDRLSSPLFQVLVRELGCFPPQRRTPSFQLGM
jgi:hypothetical protein